MRSQPSPRSPLATVPRWRWISLCAALGWTALLIVLSSDQLSADNTGGLLEQLLIQLGLVPGSESSAQLHHLLRKSGHFCGYGLLALLWHLALRPALASPLLLSLSVASWDEWHQSTLSQRSGTPADVLIDMGGACVWLGLCLYWEQWALRPADPGRLRALPAIPAGWRRFWSAKNHSG